MSDSADRDLELFRAQLHRDLENHRASLNQALEAWREQLVRQRHEWLHQLDQSLRMFGAAIDFAVLAIRSLIIVNGGAIIGILTFAGNLWGRSSPAAKATAEAIAPAMLWFVVGLSAALLCAGLSYIAQTLFVELSKEAGDKWGSIVRYIAIGAAVVSLGAFICASYLSLGAFSTPVPLD